MIFFPGFWRWCFIAMIVLIMYVYWHKIVPVKCRPDYNSIRTLIGARGHAHRFVLTQRQTDRQTDRLTD